MTHSPTKAPMSAEDFEYKIFAMQAVKHTALGEPYIDHDFLVKEIKKRDQEAESRGAERMREKAARACWYPEADWNGINSLEVSFKACHDAILELPLTDDDGETK